MYKQKESIDSKVIDKANFTLTLTDEANAKIKFVDKVKKDKVVNDFSTKFSAFIKEYDEELNTLIEEHEANNSKSTDNPTNPFALNVCGCNCKVCKMCYRLLEGEKITAQDLKNANVSLQEIAFALMLTVEAEEITHEKAASILVYLITITS